MAGDGTVWIWLPGSNVRVDYASQLERDRSLRLAEARQEIAEQGVLVLGWDDLPAREREMAALEARNWVRAAVLCELIPEAGDGDG